MIWQDIPKINTYLSKISYSGTVLIVSKNQAIKKAYGLANIEHKVENKIDTKFRIASLTKAFTAVLILKLRDQGLLALNDTLDKYIHDYPNGSAIIIQHLLTHTS